ncbi:16S rRNA (guanine(966)-N(2))-methyltransferase RsmD [Orbaceae bacterium ESL0727]|nr:16S rRNA (guanine(966)-N(2))-methyltransferase RsmD [Orbaceae bacterium ESL0727]
MNGTIRIISGKWRGRKLPVLDKAGLRPTTDRVKETLFNWLMPILQGSICLDCFAGSGSLGFEAASRGAQRVILLEKDQSTFKQLEKNNRLLQSHCVTVYWMDTLTWLRQPAKNQFDLVFIDPPFHQGLIEKTVMLLEENQWLNAGAYIYIESEIDHNLQAYIPPHWQLHREKVTGQVHSYLFIVTDKAKTLS